jgi:undecaprenyl diphosphate synthase
MTCGKSSDSLVDSSRGIERIFAMAKNNVPRHVGFIPDGTRRWPLDHGLTKEAGYVHGIDPGLLLYEKFKKFGIKEASIYCFTQDNTKRPSIQKQAFGKATVAFA